MLFINKPNVSVSLTKSLQYIVTLSLSLSISRSIDTKHIIHNGDKVLAEVERIRKARWVGEEDEIWSEKREAGQIGSDPEEKVLEDQDSAETEDLENGVA